MNNQEQQNQSNRILDAIRSGKVKMRPRWHFVLKAALLITGALLAFFTLLFLGSLLMFMLRDTGLLFFPGFGLRGWIELLRSLPWLLVVLGVIFLVLLYILVRNYRFSYRRPLLYSILFLIAASLAGALVVDKLDVQMRVHRFYRDHHLRSPVDDAYSIFHMQRFDRVHPGEIIELNDSGFILQEKMGGGTSSVIISEITKFPDGKSFVSGSRVVVFGDATSTALNERIIHALGVGKPPEFERMPFMISPGGDDMRPHPMQGR